MLDVADLDVRYGAVHAVRSVNINARAGQVTAIVGANGAGKSSTLSAISGLVKSSGHIELGGERIDALPAVSRIAMGVGHVLEGHRIFGDQPVASNLELGAYLRYRSNVPRKKIQADLEEMYTRFPVLGDRRAQRAGTLSGGEQQMLSIAVALMQRPKILLLDEPSLGLAPLLVEQVMEIIAGLRDEGYPILLVEQSTSVALKVADYGYVMALGEVVAEGEGDKLRNEIDVVSAYLGSSGDE